MTEQTYRIDSYACQRCGRRDGLDAVAPNDLWQQLSDNERWKILCLWCMDERAAALGIQCSLSLHFAGRALHGTSQSDADREHISRLAEQLEAASLDFPPGTLLRVNADGTMTRLDTEAEVERIAEAVDSYLLFPPCPGQWHIARRRDRVVVDLHENRKAAQDALRKFQARAVLAALERGDDR